MRPWTIDEVGAHGNKFAPWYPRFRKMGKPGRCWELRWRDRLAWRLFRVTASPSVAHETWNLYRWTHGAHEVRWSTPGGAHSHSLARPPREVENMIFWMKAPINPHSELCSFSSIMADWCPACQKEWHAYAHVRFLNGLGILFGSVQ